LVCSVRFLLSVRNAFAFCRFRQGCLILPAHSRVVKIGRTRVWVLVCHLKSLPVQSFFHLSSTQRFRARRRPSTWHQQTTGCLALLHNALVPWLDPSTLIHGAGPWAHCSCARHASPETGLLIRFILPRDTCCNHRTVLTTHAFIEIPIWWVGAPPSD
jgi:hypothetical protein